MPPHDAVLPTVEAFCRSQGLPSPVLVHSGSSRVYKAGDIAVRVTDSGRNPATLPDGHIAAAAAVLHLAGVATSRPATLDVFKLGDLSVTLWHWVDPSGDADTDAAWRELGRNLKLLHHTAPPFELGSLGDVLAARLAHRLELLRADRPAWLSAGDLALLHDRTAEVLPALATAAAGTLTVHGDFHHGNVLWSPTGPVISDLEGLAAGSGAYDLAVLEERVRCYGLPGHLLDALVAGYGIDLRATVGFETLVRAKQLISTQWCVVQSLRWPAFEQEARKRVAWWHAEQGPAWLTNPGAQPH